MPIAIIEVTWEPRFDPSIHTEQSKRKTRLLRHSTLSREHLSGWPANTVRVYSWIQDAVRADGQSKRIVLKLCRSHGEPCAYVNRSWPVATLAFSASSDYHGRSQVDQHAGGDNTRGLSRPIMISRVIQCRPQSHPSQAQSAAHVVVAVSTLAGFPSPGSN